MAKKIGLLLGVVFILVGILGLLGTGIIGSEGYFKTNVAHDIVHLASGILFILVSSSGALSGVLKLFGIVYLLVAVLGFMSDNGTILGLLDISPADNWLHVVFGIVLLAAGFKVGKPQAMSQMSNPAMGNTGGTM